MKPQTDQGAQLVLEGRLAGTVSAAQYQAMKRELLPRVAACFRTLAAGADIVLVEGAGSAAEVNLRACDIANMGFAAALEIPVVLVGDIDRGGVIAALVGTHALLEDGERALLAGFIVNKFRGDAGLFAPALDIIAARTGMAPLGIVPWFERAAHLPAEDSHDLETRRPPRARDGALKIVVPRLPRIANFDDLDPLAAEPRVALTLAERGAPLALCDLVLLPGSKATRADLAALRGRRAGTSTFWRTRARAARCSASAAATRCSAAPSPIRAASKAHPGRVRGSASSISRPCSTGDKILRAARGVDCVGGAPVAGYEMHMGRTSGPAAARPLLRLEGGADGAVSADGGIAGCNLHGLFASDEFRRAFLARLGAGGDPALLWEARVEETLDALAEHLEASIDVTRILEIAGAR